MAQYDRRLCPDGGRHDAVGMPIVGDDDQMRGTCRICGVEIVSNWYDDDDREVGYAPWKSVKRQESAGQ